MMISQKQANGETFPASEGVPAGFQFSQSSLQDYSDCRRRFQLRYLQRFIWPAIESEPALENERLIERGNTFHRLAHQALIGLPVERLGETIQDEVLRTWWENFCNFIDQSGLKIAAELHPETSLSAPIEAYRLTAKYDLVVSDDEGGFRIYDWKTSVRQPERKWLSGRHQTRVYPYLLASAGDALNHGKRIDPGKIEMIYWLPAYPDQPVRFPYSAAQYESDHRFITNLIEEITQLAPDQFQLTSQTQKCAYCVYRSLCERGQQAGTLATSIGSPENELQGSSERGDEGEIQIDFEQIAEIEF
jgi:CRISPR/Cas system-associated exonuclease Cas4 (RecB family)